MSAESMLGSGAILSFSLIFVGLAIGFLLIKIEKGSSAE
jgi:hypothetical protein